MRTLLILLALFGGAFAWLGLRVKQALDHHSAVDGLEAGGAEVYFADPPSFIARNKWLVSLLGDITLSDVDVIEV